MTHSLIVNYGLYRGMEIYKPTLSAASDMTRFHADDYINFLRLITPGEGTRRPLGAHLVDQYLCSQTTWETT